MPAKKYRKQVEVIETIQYNGSNQQEIITWSNGKVSSDGQGGIQLDMLGSKVPIKVTEWVYLDMFGNWLLMTDALFQIVYAPGPQTT